MLCFHKLPDNLNLVVEHFLDEVGVGTVRVEEWDLKPETGNWKPEISVE